MITDELKEIIKKEVRLVEDDYISNINITDNKEYNDSWDYIYYKGSLYDTKEANYAELYKKDNLIYIDIFLPF